MSARKPAIALFAKAPEPGRVKTRLLEVLGAERACDLHRALVQDAWEVLHELEDACGLFLYTDRPHPEWLRLAGPGLRVQRGADLGERMLACFQELHGLGFGPLLIVGGDTAGLTAGAVDPWLKLLARAEAVLGPAEDGGYWAVGCRAADARMFRRVRWSSARTLDLTLAAFRRLGWRTALLSRLGDVDEPGDLARLGSRPGLGPRTRRLLEGFAPG